MGRGGAAATTRTAVSEVLEVPVAAKATWSEYDPQPTINEGFRLLKSTLDRAEDQAAAVVAVRLACKRLLAETEAVLINAPTDALRAGRRPVGEASTLGSAARSSS